MSAPEKLLRYQSDSLGQLLTVNGRKHNLSAHAVRVLSAGSAHGYAVIEEIKRRSGGAFDLPEGTIYPALHRLEQAGLLNSRWMTADSGRRRRVYTLTKAGTRALAERPRSGSSSPMRSGVCSGQTGRARIRHDPGLS